jgi:hypothetical protein
LNARHHSATIEESTQKVYSWQSSQQQWSIVYAANKQTNKQTPARREGGRVGAEGIRGGGGGGGGGHRNILLTCRWRGSRTWGSICMFRYRRPTSWRIDWWAQRKVLVSSRIEQAANLSRRRSSSTVIRSKQARKRKTSAGGDAGPASERETKRSATKGVPRSQCATVLWRTSNDGLYTAQAHLPRPPRVPPMEQRARGRAVGGHLRWFKTQPEVDGGPSYSGFRPKNLN